MDRFGAIVILPREEASAPSPMLENILFDPAARWLSAALSDVGVTDFLVLCHPDDREAALPCFPEGAVFAAGEEEIPPFLSGKARVVAITQPVFLFHAGADRLRAARTALSPQEQADYAAQGETPDRFGIFELTPAGREALASGEALLPALEVHCPQYEGLLCVHVDEGNLYHGLQTIGRQHSVRRLQAGGVRFIDPQAAYIGPDVTVGAGTLILPGTILKGRTIIGEDCEIGPNTMIRDCVIGRRVTVNASQLNESTVDDDTTVGPFAYIRPHCRVGKEVKVGDFVELKNSTIGDGTKISHLTYVGDTDAGAHINFGCGTVTVNYDGKKKFRTTIQDGAFIGCNTNLVAPVTVGEGAYTAAGSTITQDVPPDALAIARSRQTALPGWAAKRRGSS